MGVKDSFRILLGKLIKIAVLLAVLYGAVWCYFNWEYIQERFGAKYEVERYGIVWTTNLNTAKLLAARHGRNIMIVYLHSNAKDDASDHLISRIFPGALFRQAADTYIPVLAEMPQDATDESVQTKSNREEIASAYDLRNHYGQLVLTDAEGKELQRVRYGKESEADLLAKLSGGKFVPLPPIPKTGVKDPVAESAAKAKQVAAPVMNKVTDGKPKAEKVKTEEKYGITTGL